jgi:hypothetical protein
LRAAGTIDVTIDGQASETSFSVSEPSIQRKNKDDWSLMHPLWKNEYVNRVAYTHLPPKDFIDSLALNTIRAIRFNFDWMSGTLLRHSLNTHTDSFSAFFGSG